MLNKISRTGAYRPLSEQSGGHFYRTVLADDSNVYVQSRRAGERVMASLKRFLEEKLKLRLNDSKSAVAEVGERTFLGYRLVAAGKLVIAPESLKRAVQRIQQITRRSRGIRLERMIEELNNFLSGWVTYFRWTEYRSQVKRMDEWIRRRLRCVQLKQRKRRYSMVQLLRQFGIPEMRAWSVCSSRGWWRLSCHPVVHEAMNIQWFKKQGLVNLTERYVALQH